MGGQEPTCLPGGNWPRSCEAWLEAEPGASPKVTPAVAGRLGSSRSPSGAAIPRWASLGPSPQGPLHRAAHNMAAGLIRESEAGARESSSKSEVPSEPNLRSVTAHHGCPFRALTASHQAPPALKGRLPRCEHQELATAPRLGTAYGKGLGGETWGFPFAAASPEPRKMPDAAVVQCIGGGGSLTAGAPLCPPRQDSVAQSPGESPQESPPHAGKASVAVQHLALTSLSEGRRFHPEGDVRKLDLPSGSSSIPAVTCF